MIGVGIDAVELPRFRLALERTPRIADRLFSDAERAYAFRRKDPTTPCNSTKSTATTPV